MANPRRVGTLLLAALLLAACGGDGAGVLVESARPIESASADDDPPPDIRPDLSVPPSSDAAPDDPDDGAVGSVADPTDVDVTEPVIIEPELAVEIPLADVVDIGGNKPARDHDDFVAVAFTDVERWWAEQFPLVYGTEFEPLDGGIYAGYPERSEAIPGCGERTTDYADLQLFVAFYCNFGDFMAYDDGEGRDSLLTPLADQFGSAVMGVVLAHEYGHVIQERIGALNRPLATIVTEQQADCFAGAWTGQAYRGESPLLRLGDSDVRAGLLAMLNVRDPVGVNQFTPGGHGSAFDRVGAFQVGFIAGPARCAELLDDPLPLMPNEFQPLSIDEFLGGNSPYDCDLLDPNVVGQDFIDVCRDAPEFLAEDINHFWKVAFEGDWEPITVLRTDDLADVTCDGVRVLTPQVAICPADRSLVYDEPEVLELYDEFGDFTLGYVYGIAAAEFAQIDLDSPLTGEARALLNDCFTGAWVRDITPDATGRTGRNQLDEDDDGEPDATVVSSPGDLDEAIQMTILLGDIGVNVDNVGTAFEKIDAFRDGVLNGLGACAIPAG